MGLSRKKIDFVEDVVYSSCRVYEILTDLFYCMKPSKLGDTDAFSYFRQHRKGIREYPQVLKCLYW